MDLNSPPLSYLVNTNVHIAAHRQSRQFTPNVSPVQLTWDTEPVFVYPILQVHNTAFVAASWEQTALKSHPPFVTWQLSATSRRKAFLVMYPFNYRLEMKILPVQVTFAAVPVLVYPVLHTHFTALLVASWIHVAFLSHPPLLVWQLSEITWLEMFS